MLFQALHGVGWGETFAFGWSRDQLARVGTHVHCVVLILIIRMLPSLVFVNILVVLAHLLCDLGGRACHRAIVPLEDHGV